MGPDVQGGTITGCLPLCPFPPLHWWAVALNGAPVDTSASYQKQTLRNRLVISGPQGRQVISFPIQHGDGDTKAPILSAHQAPIHAWRTLETAYGNSAFFEHFKDELFELWMTFLPQTDADRKALNDWNWASIEWVCEQCNWLVPQRTEQAPSIGSVTHDLRIKQSLRGDGWTYHRYPQLFEPAHGFVGGCSVLDALFVLGPNALQSDVFELVSAPTS